MFPKNMLFFPKDHKKSRPGGEGPDGFILQISESICSKEPMRF